MPRVACPVRAMPVWRWILLINSLELINCDEI
jgi:hypothetical protein